MKTSLKVTLVTAIVAVTLIVGAIVYAFSQAPSDPPADGEPQQTTRSDSHVLDDGGEDAVTVVEFLDFECGACAAFHPIVADLREKYVGDITYVVRYFPLQGHVNSVTAAVAVEAAAQQGRFEDMADALFATQQQWGNAGTQTPEVFRGLAEQLGLDMVAFDAAVADPATQDRVESDFRDGIDLGVESTPTFFIDGEAVVMNQFTDLEKAIEAAVNG